MLKLAGVLGPSDLLSVEQPLSCAVGGRVAWASTVALMLADAFGTIPVSFTSPVAQAQPGTLVVIAGRWSDGELVADRIEWCEEPLAATRAGEHTRLLGEGVGRHLILRARVLRAVRDWFDDRGFVEVETPLRVPSPGLDLHLDAFEAGGDFLITSPEYQMKRLLVGGMPRIYQLAHCFRRGEVGARHNPEFSMLEWYRAFAGIDDVMADTEQLIAALATEQLGSPVLTLGDRKIDVSAPFERITVLEAFARFASVNERRALEWAESDEDRYFRTWVEHVEPHLEAFDRAIFLTGFPAPQASLARLVPSDPRICERFELYVGGLELCNGFGELTDPLEQRARLERDVAARAERGLPAYPIDERFLGALEEGMPPSGGNALGIDRLISLLAGVGSIGQVLSFPADWL